METKKQNFKGKEFTVVRGTTHPDYSYDTFEKEENDFREKYWNISPGQVIFDVGASYGSYSLTAAAMGGIVYSFEPEKTIFLDLTYNILLNNWYKTCFPINAGLWSSKVVVDMKSYAPHWPSFTISGDYKMETLDRMVEMLNLKQLDIVKIDVEGAEEHVLFGGLNAIKKFRPKLFIECHVFLDNELNNKVKNIISSIGGYAIEEINRTPCTIVIATPQAQL